jgi:monoamine oxidase
MISSSILEGGDPVVSGIQSVHGILEIQLGGKQGEQAGPHLVPQALKDIAQIDAKSSASFEDISHVQNWKLFPWSQGSRAFLKPGQFQLLDTATAADGWAFAGDWHSVNWLGTMNGAIQTGFDAAYGFIKTMS